VSMVAGSRRLLSLLDPARARRRISGEIISMIDRLPIVQPGTWSCPDRLADTPVVTFTFRAKEGGPALARADESADVTEPTTPCDPLSLSIRGHRQTPLLGGAVFLRSSQRLLGVTLSSSP
jgi:hypothetical protein